MSVIAIKGIPQKWSLVSTAKYFKIIIPGMFEALHFVKNKQYYKTVYLSLSEALDPDHVIDRIHNAKIRPKLELHAYLPSTLPDMPLSIKEKNSASLSNRWTKLNAESPYRVIQITHNELLLEIQYKYPELYNLSRKTGHKLLEEIAKIIFERVKNIMGAHFETRENCFKLSGRYRKLHPHGRDFQLIVDILHALQDKSGAPRSQIQEKDLLQQPVNPYTYDNEKDRESIKSACNKYSDMIVHAISAHMESLNEQITDDYNEDVARKKVREEMKKILPYLPAVVKQVVAKNVVPEQAPMHRIRIYGEPFLPPKDAMSPFVTRYHAGASRIIRHPRMYNLLLFKITHRQYAQLMAMDGTIVNGAKLVIRSDNPELYEASAELRSEMSAALGGPRGAPIEVINDDWDY